MAAEFTAEERNLLVRLPRWIVDAAVAAGGGHRGRHEVDNGFLAVAAGRKLGNPLVTELADAAITVYDQDPKTSGVDPATEEGRDLVLGYSQTAMKILREKAAADASSYRRWLLSITDAAITTVRTIGGVQIHAEQKQFRERLADLTRATPPTA